MKQLSNVLKTPTIVALYRVHYTVVGLVRDEEIHSSHWNANNRSDPSILCVCVMGECTFTGGGVEQPPPPIIARLSKVRSSCSLLCP